MLNYSIIIGTILIFQVSLIITDDFVVNSSKCKLPYFPAFSEETNSIYLPENYTSCNDTELLTYTTVVNNTAFLHIRNEHIEYYSSAVELWCYYSYISRNGSQNEPDIGISISPYTYFNTTVRLTGDIVKVICYNDTYGIVYENVHSPITVSPPVRKKLTTFAKENEQSTPLSVLLIVIDSVARLNFVRTMPKTRNFLLQNGFIEFVGYNKIDDNTFPNFNALLTGLNLRQSYEKCKPTKVGKLDECPMIWYDFRRLGYITAYAEDWAPVSTYNYLKKGFKNPPTDYYFKPYIEAAETLYILNKQGLPYCTGPETEGERILNLARDFSTTFKENPHFGIFWMNTFSHNYINSPTGMDEKVMNFFQDIHGNGILNSSIVILLSDHGIRFGNIRTTIQGWYEERLPINLISVPDWFKTKYSNKYENLKKNSNKLTSTYDLYMTLQDILNMSVKNYTISPSLACATCSSLFADIPEHRSCKEAGIPEFWCTCLGRFNNTDKRIDTEMDTRAAMLALDQIKQDDNWVDNNTLVYKVWSSSISSVSSRKGYYLITFETTGLELFQALFKIYLNPIKIVNLVQYIKIW